MLRAACCKSSFRSTGSEKTSERSNVGILKRVNIYKSPVVGGDRNEALLPSARGICK